MTNTTTIPQWRLQDRLARSLDQADISVQAMADELDVNRNTISNYLHGRSRPSKAVLGVWALRTGVPYRWLAFGEEVPTDTEGVTLWEPDEYSQGQLQFAA